MEARSLEPSSAARQRRKRGRAVVGKDQSRDLWRTAACSSSSGRGSGSASMMGAFFLASTFRLVAMGMDSDVSECTSVSFRSCDQTVVREQRHFGGRRFKRDGERHRIAPGGQPVYRLLPAGLHFHWHQRAKNRPPRCAATELPVSFDAAPGIGKLHGWNAGAIDPIFEKSFERPIRRFAAA